LQGVDSGGCGTRSCVCRLEGVAHVDFVLSGVVNPAKRLGDGVAVGTGAVEGKVVGSQEGAGRVVGDCVGGRSVRSGEDPRRRALREVIARHVSVT